MAVLVAERVSTPVGDALYLLRKQAGLSQKGLAAASGVERSYISMIENGQRDNPSRAVLDALAKAMGVTTRELYRRAGLVWSEAEIDESAVVIPASDREKAAILRRLSRWPVDALTRFERALDGYFYEDGTDLEERPGGTSEPPGAERGRQRTQRPPSADPHSSG